MVILLAILPGFLLVDVGPWFFGYPSRISTAPPAESARATNRIPDVAPPDTTRMDLVLAAAHADSVETGRRLLLAQYENAVKEIQSRIAEESRLFVLKFTLVGAILALLFKTQLTSGNPLGEDVLNRIRCSPVAAVFFWAAVMTSAIIDTRILFHADIIETLGRWIAAKVEPTFLGGKTPGWETYILTKGRTVFLEPTYPLLRLNAQLLTWVLFAGTILLFFRPPDAPALARADVRRICLAGSLGSFVVFALAGLHFHYAESEWPWFCVISGLVGSGVSVRVWCERTRRAR